MNHKLHGAWSSFRVLVIDSGGSITHTPVPDGEMFLRIPNDATGVIEMGSNHDGRPITGHATPVGGNSIRIDIDQDESTFVRKYVGFLSKETDIFGQKVLVLSGTFKNVPKPPVRPDINTAGQEQGTWVATKP